MDALDLIVLGRQLTKIGEHAIRGRTPTQTPTGRALVMRDVFAHPDSSVSDVTARTGLRQSYVSESIAALREDGILETSPDPKDRRLTRASIRSAHRRRVAKQASTPIDAALAEVAGPAQARQALALLQRLAELFQADQPGPIIATIRANQARPLEPNSCLTEPCSRRDKPSS